LTFGLLLVVADLGEALAHSPLLALVTLFGAGLVTSLTPCIYPMLPITAGILAGTGAGQTSRARVARLTFAYVSGLALFYAVLGLIAGLTGSLFGTVSASPWARFAIGNLLLVFGLAMLDVVPVSAPQRLLQWAGRLTGGSYAGVFLLGTLQNLMSLADVSAQSQTIVTGVLLVVSVLGPRMARQVRETLRRRRTAGAPAPERA